MAISWGSYLSNTVRLSLCTPDSINFYYSVSHSFQWIMSWARVSQRRQAILCPDTTHLAISECCRQGIPRNLSRKKEVIMKLGYKLDFDLQSNVLNWDEIVFLSCAIFFLIKLGCSFSFQEAWGHTGESYARNVFSPILSFLVYKMEALVHTGNRVTVGRTEWEQKWRAW